MTVAIAGGAGFTGRRVAARLCGLHDTVRCLVREPGAADTLPDAVEVAGGDLADAAALDRWLDGAQSLVYCASMGFGHVPGVVAACSRAGVGRSVFVSTTGIHTRLAPASMAVRLEAEECVRASAMDWTIVRPTMIYGGPGDRNMERLLARLARRRTMLVPGSGRGLMQPVHVDDLADGIVAALGEPAAVGKAYEMSGPRPLTFVEVIEIAARALGRTPSRIHVPLAPVAWALRLAEVLRVPLPVKSEQVRRLAEDKAFGHDLAAHDLGFSPRSFADGIAQEARALGLATEASP